MKNDEMDRRSEAGSRFSNLPSDRQEEVAALMIALIDETPCQLSPDERQAVEDGFAAVAAGDFVDE